MTEIRRLTFALFFFMSIAILGLPGVIDGTFSALTDKENINGSAQAGYWNGTIEIVKDSDPADPQLFSFTPGGGSLVAFDLQDNNNEEDGNPSSEAFSGLAPGVYTFTEDALPNFDITGISCDIDDTGGTDTPVLSTVKYLGGADAGTNLTWEAGDNQVEITLQGGDIVECTFDNTKKGEIVIVKKTDVANTSGNDFDFQVKQGATTIATPSLTGAIGAGESAPAVLVTPGSYTVTELPVFAGWSFQSVDCGPGDSIVGQTATITVAAGQTVTCTFENKQNSATFTVNKVYSPIGPATAVNITLTCTAGNGTIIDNTLTAAPGAGNAAVFTINGITAPSTTCTAVETVPAGYTSNHATTCANIVVSANGNPSCTITNTQNSATFKVFKLYSGGAAVPPEVNIQLTCGTGTVTVGGVVDNTDDAAPGANNEATFVVKGITGASTTCTAVETPVPAGYQSNHVAQCTSITLNANGSADCTITNTKLGTIVITKDVYDNTGTVQSTTDPLSFAFTDDIASGTCGVSGNNIGSLADNGTAGANTITCVNVTPGPYTVTEGTLPAGWTFGGITCTDPTSNSGFTGQQANIALGAGETVSCIFKNNQPAPAGATLVIKKQVTGDNEPTDFDFDPITVSLGVNFILDDDADDAGQSDTKTYGSLAAGTYSVRELAETGFTIGNISCTGGASITYTGSADGGATNASFDSGDHTFSVALSGTQTATCTFINTSTAVASAFCAAFTGVDDRFHVVTGSSPNPFTVPDGNDRAVIIDNPNGHTVNGGSGSDCIVGNVGNDTINGREGNDRIDGGAGNDTITGGNGNDTLNGGDGNDTITDGDSFDANGNGNDTLNGGAGDDTLNGGEGSDVINGDAGNDTLLGDIGDDDLNGGADDDILRGGNDADDHIGGSGNDACVDFSGSNTFTTCEGADLDVGSAEGTQELNDASGWVAGSQYTLLNQGGSSQTLTVTFGGTITLNGINTADVTSGITENGSSYSCTTAVGSATTFTWSCTGTITAGTTVTVNVSVTGDDVDADAGDQITFTPSIPTCTGAITPLANGCLNTESDANLDGGSITPAADLDTIT